MVKSKSSKRSSIKKSARSNKKTPKKNRIKKKNPKKTKPAIKKWSHNVTEHSHAMDLEPGVFTWKNPKKIAKSLLASASASHSRKSPPYQSAMSMLNFYINRGGKSLNESTKEILKKAKHELELLKPES